MEQDRPYIVAYESIRTKSIPALNLDYEELENRVQAALCSIQNELALDTIKADLRSALAELENIAFIATVKKVARYTNSI